MGSFSLNKANGISIKRILKISVAAILLLGLILAKLVMQFEGQKDELYENLNLLFLGGSLLMTILIPAMLIISKLRNRIFLYFGPDPWEKAGACLGGVWLLSLALFAITGILFDNSGHPSYGVVAVMVLLWEGAILWTIGLIFSIMGMLHLGNTNPWYRRWRSWSGIGFLCYVGLTLSLMIFFATISINRSN